MVLDKCLRTGSAAGVHTAFDCEFDRECAADDFTTCVSSHALLLLLLVTGQTTDMSSGLLTTDSDWCTLPPAAASPQCGVDGRHDVSTAKQMT